jgi:hypothetical protein
MTSHKIRSGEQSSNTANASMPFEAVHTPKPSSCNMSSISSRNASVSSTTRMYGFRVVTLDLYPLRSRQAKYHFTLWPRHEGARANNPNPVQSLPARKALRRLTPSRVRDAEKQDSLHPSATPETTASLKKPPLVRGPRDSESAASSTTRQGGTSSLAEVNAFRVAVV